MFKQLLPLEELKLVETPPPPLGRTVSGGRAQGLGHKAVVANTDPPTQADSCKIIMHEWGTITSEFRIQTKGETQMAEVTKVFPAGHPEMDPGTEIIQETEGI